MCAAVLYLQAAYRNALQVRKLVMKGKGKSQGLVSYLSFSSRLLKCQYAENNTIFCDTPNWIAVFGFNKPKPNRVFENWNHHVYLCMYLWITFFTHVMLAYHRIFVFE